MPREPPLQIYYDYCKPEDWNQKRPPILKKKGRKNLHDIWQRSCKRLDRLKHKADEEDRKEFVSKKELLDRIPKPSYRIRAETVNQPPPFTYKKEDSRWLLPNVTNKVDGNKERYERTSNGILNSRIDDTTQVSNSQIRQATAQGKKPKKVRFALPPVDPSKPGFNGRASRKDLTVSSEEIEAFNQKQKEKQETDNAGKDIELKDLKIHEGPSQGEEIRNDLPLPSLQPAELEDYRPTQVSSIRPVPRPRFPAQIPQVTSQIHWNNLSREKDLPPEKLTSLPLKKQLHAPPELRVIKEAAVDKSQLKPKPKYESKLDIGGLPEEALLDCAMSWYGGRGELLSHREVQKLLRSRYKKHPQLRWISEEDVTEIRIWLEDMQDPDGLGAKRVKNVKAAHLRYHAKWKKKATWQDWYREALPIALLTVIDDDEETDEKMRLHNQREFADDSQYCNMGRRPDPMNLATYWVTTPPAELRRPGPYSKMRKMVEPRHSGPGPLMAPEGIPDFYEIT